MIKNKKKNNSKVAYTYFPNSGALFILEVTEDDLSNKPLEESQDEYSILSDILKPGIANRRKRNGAYKQMVI